jgi:hypothetical protein
MALMVVDVLGEEMERSGAWNVDDGKQETRIALIFASLQYLLLVSCASGGRER